MQEDTWEYFWTTMRFDCGVSNGEPIEKIVDKIVHAFDSAKEQGMDYNEGAVMQALRDCYAELDCCSID